MRLAAILIAIGCSLCFTSCQNPIYSAGAEADRVIARTESTTERALTRVDQSVAAARAEMGVAVQEFRTEYDGMLKDTSTEVSKLREEFNQDITALESKLEERITQVETAALKVIAEGDAAAEARIDQLFTELRLFVKETLAQIKDLIGPVLSMAENISKAVEKGQEHFATVVEKVLELVEKVAKVIDTVQASLVEIQGTVRKFTGRDPKTGEETGTNPLGPILGALGTLLAGYTQFRRVQDHKQDGARWKPDALSEKTKADVSKMIKDGEFDDEIRGRLVKLGMVAVRPNGGES